MKLHCAHCGARVEYVGQNLERYDCHRCGFASVFAHKTSERGAAESIDLIKHRAPRPSRREPTPAPRSRP